MPKLLDTASGGAPALDLLLLANIAPLALYLWAQPYYVVALAYVAGNAVWIALLYRVGEAVEVVEGTRLAWIPALVMVAGALSWAWVSELTGTINGGLGWDGRQYASLYWHFARQQFWPIVPEFPYSQRVAFPWMAAHVPLDLFDAFRALQALFWLATIAMFAAWCRRALGMRSIWIHTGVLWLQILWLSIPRGTAVYSVGVDAPTVFFAELWIVLLTHPRWIVLLPLCAFIGVVFKETMLLIAALSLVAMMIVRVLPGAREILPPEWRSLRRYPWIALALAVVSGAIGKMLAAHLIGNASVGHSSEAATLAKWWSVRGRSPVQEALRYSSAVFGAYGGFVLLWAATIGKPALRGRTWIWRFLACITVLYLAVCWLAGSDLTRFAFLGFPFILPVLLTEIEEVPAYFAVLALLLGLPASHICDAIPSPLPGGDYPHSDLGGIYSWMMEYAHPAIVGSWLAWWLAAILLLRKIAFTRVWRLPAPTGPSAHALRSRNNRTDVGRGSYNGVRTSIDA